MNYRAFVVEAWIVLLSIRGLFGEENERQVFQGHLNFTLRYKKKLFGSRINVKLAVAFLSVCKGLLCNIQFHICLGFSLSVVLTLFLFYL